MHNILNNLKVVEFAGVLAGPRVGMFLAEMGAHVCKVEPPQGDITRQWKLAKEPPDAILSAYYCSVNWGKNVINIDLQNAQERLKAVQLALEADIVLVSYKPGDAQKFGLAYEQLAERNPKLIYGSITGYGKHSSRVGYDAIIQAETGFTFMNGNNEQDYHKMPVALMDVLAAEQLKTGILAALIQRMQTGKGQEVSVSLYQAGVAALVNQATNYLVANHLAIPQGSEHPNIVPYGTQYRTQDNHSLVLAVGTDEQFKKLLTILHLGHLLNNERCSTNYARVQNRTWLSQILANAIAAWEIDALLYALHNAKVPAGKVMTIREVFMNDLAKSMVYQSGHYAAVSTIAFKEKNNDLKGIVDE